MSAAGDIGFVLTVVNVLRLLQFADKQGPRGSAAATAPGGTGSSIAFCSIDSCDGALAIPKVPTAGAR